jgi:peroxiredoxin
MTTIKTRLLAAAAAALFALAPLAARAEIAIGKPAPDFTGTDTANAVHRLSDYKGKIVVLEWTNPHCPYVHKEYDSGTMQALQREATAEGVVWLMVDSSAKGSDGWLDAERGAEYLKGTRAAATALLLDEDGTIGKLYEAKATPHMFVIGKDGTLAYRGAIDDRPSAEPASLKGAKNYVRAALDDLEAGRPVATSVTQAYGCNIKYQD